MVASAQGDPITGEGFPKQSDDYCQCIGLPHQCENYHCKYEERACSGTLGAKYGLPTSIISVKMKWGTKEKRRLCKHCYEWWDGAVAPYKMPQIAEDLPQDGLEEASSGSSANWAIVASSEQAPTVADSDNAHEMTLQIEALHYRVHQLELQVEHLLYAARVDSEPEKWQ